MATLEQLEEGIKRAHAAGDADNVRILGQAYRELQQQASQQPTQDIGSSLPGPVGQFQDTSRAFQSGAQQGMTLGFGDELEAGLFAVPEAIGGMFQGRGFDIGQGYNQALDRARGMNEQERDLNPVANIAGNVTGNMALAANLPNFSRGAAPTIGSMALRGSADGLIYGAINGFGTGEELGERVTQAASGGALGGIVGGAAGGVAGALANRGVAAATPASDEIAQEAGVIYEAAKQSGVVFPKDTVKTVADDIAAKAITEGLDPTLHPGATAALKRLQDSASGNLTVQDAQTLRRILNAPRGNIANPDEARIAGQMVREFDSFVASQVPELGGANAIYATAKKTELIENTIQKARDMSAANYSASGFENALRQQFKNLLTSRTALRGFTDAEVAAIRKVAEGGPIENFMRYIGKLAPTGVISAGIGGGAGYAVGGPVGAAAVLGGGALARSGATASTLNNANLARALIANGGQMPQINSSVAQALMNGGTGALGGTAGSVGNREISRALFGQ